MMALVLGSLLFSGYGSSENATKSKLDGTWISNDIGKSTLVINGDINSFSSQTQDYYVSGQVTMNVDGEKIVQPNDTVAQKTTSMFTKYERTPLSQNYVDLFNSTAECGFTDWALNTPKSLVGSTCSVAYRNIRFLEGNRLINGDMYTVGSDGYPNALHATDYFTKQ